ncbi:MAG: hypothetical protein F2621_00300 [Actinobacteria bacterium]|uniref:Unannotated protein n=1 Tax=freshwater metagenome TaxID=449393 RepID=A0A6J6JAH9_9ZZZZ|nr:hypothetical protein [Actinomycetota bacterium]MTA32650.1 hypothetical protein [Actinomycetota bacterium]
MPWFWRKKKQDSPAYRITPRKEPSPTSKVDVSELTPPAADYLASACILELTAASELAAVASEAWSAEDADALMVASGMAMDRYRALRALVADYEKDVSGAIATPRHRLSGHLERFVTTRWYERVGTIYVVFGLTRDFWLLLAGGLPKNLRTRVTEILRDGGEEDLLTGVLERVLQVDTRYVSRLSLWARRLVGDAMLICKDALDDAVVSADDAVTKLEPIFTDVLARHTSRLERVGLTA